MISKTITYTDYEGQARTETFYFNLNKAELMEMNLSQSGGLEKMIRKIVAEEDTKKIVALFKDIILRSYGEKSEDGRQFEKSPELAKAFSQTEAYSELFMELISNEDAAAAFMNGVIPQALAAEVAEMQKSDPGLVRPFQAPTAAPIPQRGSARPDPRN